MTSEIKPRVDDGGVPWCDAGCPQYKPNTLHLHNECKIDGTHLWLHMLCPHAVRRMAVELEACKELLWHPIFATVFDGGKIDGKVYDRKKVNALLDGSAVDALLAERDGLADDSCNESDDHALMEEE